jgi:hypothetical protein
MSFISRAEEFLEDQGDLSSDKYCEAMIETVRYLLQNARGYENRKSTPVIFAHIRQAGFTNIKTKEDWQNYCLNKLRNHGIFIGSKIGGRGGIFLIQSKLDALMVQSSYEHRITTETNHLNELESQMREAGWL